MTLLDRLHKSIGGRSPDLEAAVLPEAVVLHLKNLTEAEAAPLEDDLQPLLSQLPETYSTGADQEGTDVSLYIYTEDAASALAHLMPALRTHPLSCAADVTLQTRQPGSTYAMDFRRFPIQNDVPALETLL